jgi:hypothetical protein
MSNATCVFDLQNDEENEILLYLEPEGFEFILSVGKAIQVHLFGSESPIEMKHSSDAKGRKMISFWPVNGNFELFFEGENILG